MPSGPSAFSTKSRTSRPRSPIRPSTTTSACTPRASIASSVDLPTPEPANSPMRWPRASGSSVSNTASPVGSRAPIARRCAAGGGLRRSGARRGPSASGRPSIGWPKASTTRPIHARLGLTPSSGSSHARSPTATPSPEPNHIARAPCPSSATISASTGARPCGVTRTRSPRRPARPSPPMRKLALSTAVTSPQTRSGRSRSIWVASASRPIMTMLRIFRLALTFR